MVASFFLSTGRITPEQISVVDVSTTTVVEVVVDDVKKDIKFDFDSLSTTTRRRIIIKEIEDEFGPHAEVMKRVSHCESSLIPWAKNKNSSATGLFQIIKGTWEGHKCEGDITNYKDNISCAKKIHDGPQGLGAWSESFSCWKKTFKVE